MSMLLNALLLVLREVLEAAVLLSLLWNFSKVASLSTRWVIPAALMGVVVAVCYAAAIEWVTDWWDGSGQERISAMLHLAVYLPVLILVWALYRPLPTNYTLAAMVVIFIAAMIREGSEIVIYVGAFADAPNVKGAVFSGALIGAGIAISCGVLVSALLATLTRQQTQFWIGICLVFVASGMMLQAVSLLDQAGLIGYSDRAFDLESWVSEQSVLGQMLYAVFGYDSQPSWVQLGVYAASLTLAFSLMYSARRLAINV
ncbi:FTR1 family protein [Aequoribacter sp.]|uniref:FTR1 family protein n=1 Tax=Aequoribacter sp. TaxID=2847771 RepID=UPI003F69799D